MTEKCSGQLLSLHMQQRPTTKQPPPPTPPQTTTTAIATTTTTHPPPPPATTSHYHQPSTVQALVLRALALELAEVVAGLAKEEDDF